MHTSDYGRFVKSDFVALELTQSMACAARKLSRRTHSLNCEFGLGSMRPGVEVALGAQSGRKFIAERGQGRRSSAPSWNQIVELHSLIPSYRNRPPWRLASRPVWQGRYRADPWSEPPARA